MEAASVWFSSAVKAEADVIIGELSFRLLILMVISCSESAIDPFAVTKITYEDLVSKSGAELKVNVPVDESRLIRLASAPDIAKVTVEPKGSSAATVPISVWFSSALKLDAVEKTGPSGSTSVIFIWISWSVTISPSEALSFAENEAKVSKSGLGLKVKTPEEASTLTAGKLIELGVASLPIPAWMLQ